MANAQISRLAYKEEPILQMPLPVPPPLAEQIKTGVLKQPEARAHDQQMRRWVEQVQNIIRLSLRWPQLEQWQDQLANIVSVQGSLVSALATLTALQTSLASLSSQAASQASQISTLQQQVANLLAFANVENRMVFTFLSPTNPWTMAHNRAMRPSVVRMLVLLPASASYLEFHGMVTEVDVNTSRVDWAANYQGEAIIDF